MGGSFDLIWLEYYAWTQNILCWFRPSIRYFSIFWQTPNKLFQQSLKVRVVLGVTTLLLNSCGWLLWSNVVEILCVDTDKIGCVNKVLIVSILSSFEGSWIPTCSRFSCGHMWMKFNAWILIKQPVSTKTFHWVSQGSCRWLLWSYLVEMLHLDKDKTGYVNKVLIIHILLFFEGYQVPTYSRI